MTVEDYLRTSFDGTDCEFLDGEVVERNMDRSRGAKGAELHPAVPGGALVDVLRTENPTMDIPLMNVLKPLDV